MVDRAFTGQRRALLANPGFEGAATGLDVPLGITFDDAGQLYVANMSDDGLNATISCS